MSLLTRVKQQNSNNTAQESSTVAQESSTNNAQVRVSVLVDVKLWQALKERARSERRTTSAALSVLLDEALRS